MAGTDYTWAIDACMESESADAAVIVEELMANPKCVAFGPVHHFLVGAAVLTAYRNATGEGKDKLQEDLMALGARAVNVPGGACAAWGVCGAAASCGMAYAIVADNAPRKAEGWAEGQRLVSEILGKIVDAGSPRCCKRDSRIAVRTAMDAFERDFNMAFGRDEDLEVVCATSPKNKVCIKTECVYYGN